MKQKMNSGKYSPEKDKKTTTFILKSFHVKRSNLVEVRARTNPDLPSLVIFERSKILDHEQIGNGAHTTP